eukprot:TRINITY_DN14042_c0_g1_i1.p1 TRINITY_DN14042_c0_g1~~TRINITY_DN14042_c0_g1_i1.p1  ORF type:complete len:256 (+),score=61.24 TRINITY_DN14042_c0_g1_i1:101-868(+)
MRRAARCAAAAPGAALSPPPGRRRRRRTPWRGLAAALWLAALAAARATPRAHAAQAGPQRHRPDDPAHRRVRGAQLAPPAPHRLPRRGRANTTTAAPAPPVPPVQGNATGGPGLPVAESDARAATAACLRSSSPDTNCLQCTARELELLQVCRAPPPAPPSDAPADSAAAGAAAYTGWRQLSCPTAGQSRRREPAQKRRAGYAPCVPSKGGPLQVAYFEAFWLVVGTGCGIFMRRRRAQLVLQQQQRYLRLMERV